MTCSRPPALHMIMQSGQPSRIYLGSLLVVLGGDHMRELSLLRRGKARVRLIKAFKGLIRPCRGP